MALCPKHNSLQFIRVYPTMEGQALRMKIKEGEAIKGWIWMTGTVSEKHKMERNGMDR